MSLIPSQNPTEWLNIDSTDALAAQLELIDEWKPVREVFSLKYGDKILGLSAGFTGLALNVMFRSTLKLRLKGAIFTGFFLSAGPAFLAQSAHKYLITNSIILYENQCPLCLEVKGIASMTFCGFIYPLLVAPTINLAIAGSLGYRIPYIYEVKEIARYVWTAYKPQYRLMLLVMCSNAILTSVVTYKQLETMENLTHILERVHRYMDNQKAELDNAKFEI